MTRRGLLLGSIFLACAAACSDDDGGDADRGGGGRDGGSQDAGRDGDAAAGFDAAPPAADASVDPAVLPEPTGDCPGFAEDQGCTRDDVSLICMFAPEGLVPRPVRIWMDAGAGDGPLVVYWHGLGRSAADAARLGSDVMAAILEAGGIVAAPERSEKREVSDFGMPPWLLAYGTGEEDDLFVLDEVVACAEREVGIDNARIHITGMSAGGLQAGQVGPRRSQYVASMAVFSGGQFEDPEAQDPDNHYAVILFHGGPDDQVLISFDSMQTAYRDRLQERGHFVLLCDHGQGHTVPPDAAAAAWVFLADHPKGIDPEPYADQLPATIPDYCTR